MTICHDTLNPRESYICHASAPPSQATVRRILSVSPAPEFSGFSFTSAINPFAALRFPDAF